MGLGKTIQVIAFLAAIMGKTGHAEQDISRLQRIKEWENEGEPGEMMATTLGKTALILCPTSVTYQWLGELRTWGYFDAIVLRDHQTGIQEMKQFRRGRTEIVICGTDYARAHIDELRDEDWSAIIVDECHRGLKTPTSATRKAFVTFTCPVRFGLTGTAIQNRYSELWAILDWANPGCVGNLKLWKTWVSDPISSAQRKGATTMDLSTGRARAHGLVTGLLPHFFLRRTKALIVEQLPKKTDLAVFCRLTPEQAHAYEELLKLPRVQDIIQHAQPCPCGDPKKTRGEHCGKGWSQEIFKYLNLFQKISNHLILIYPDREVLRNDPDMYAQTVEWVQTAFPDDHQERRYILRNQNDPKLCGKWQLLQAMLKKWKDAGDKVLLFSHSIKLLDCIEGFINLDAEYNYRRLDGTTAPDERMNVVNEYNNDPDVFIFLISTKAGGVGLNLTAANRVVIFDPNWNPSHDLQAQDRAFRIGQRRDVNVYRLIGAGSLEELIYTRQIYKQHAMEVGYKAAYTRRLWDGKQDDKHHKGELFGVENLFKFNKEVQLDKTMIEVRLSLLSLVIES
ncbi:hypothetical protein BT69DRAFT_371018 [Atractiella rhizophila]|nr:hypothetical protein BT69DRAFT_371018 [Atractiella rhizophila]